MRRAYPAYRDSGVEWLGVVPAHWEVRKLNRVCRFAYGDTLVSEQRIEGDVPVFGSNGALDWHVEANTLAPVIVVGRKGSFGQVSFSPRAVYAIDTTYLIDQRSTGSYLRWLYYALLCADLADTSMDSAVPGLSREHAYGKYLPLPNREDQKSIASFLDRETARIDKLVEKNRLLIERLAEYRTAMITRAVTRGLDPSARLKPSGVEWLGDIPEHWEARRLSYCCDIVNGGTPSSSNEHYWDGEIAWLTPDDIGQNPSVTIERGRRSISLEGVANSNARISPADSVVLSTRAPIGHLAVTVTPAATNQGCRTLVPGVETCSWFVYFGLLASRQVLQAAGKGSTFMELSLTDLSNLVLSMPTLCEQRKIVTFLKSEMERIDTLKSRTEAAIERLQEYRAALITAAVTGKIDVREPEPAQ